MAYDFFPGRIKDIINETDTVKRFFIEVVNEKIFYFIHTDILYRSFQNNYTYAVN